MRTGGELIMAMEEPLSRVRSLSAVLRFLGNLPDECELEAQHIGELGRVIEDEALRIRSVWDDTCELLRSR